MSTLRMADDAPFFEDDAALSPTALNILLDILLALDEGTRLGGVVFTASYGQAAEESGEQAQVIWRGGGVWEAGMTTLRLVTSTTGTVLAGDTLRIYRGDPDANGALPATYHDLTIASGAQTHTISLTGAGYAEGDAVRLHAEVRHAVKPGGAGYSGCRVSIDLAELLPVALPDAAPTNPTFASNADVTGTKLSQLADFVRWLVRRAARRYDPLFITQLRRIGPYCIPEVGTDPNVRWRGGWRKTPLHTTLRARGRTMRVWGGATEEIRLSVNGSVVATHPVPQTIGETPWELTHSLAGYASGAALTLQLQYVRTAPQQDDMPVNRWTVTEVLVDTPTGGASTLGEWDIRQPNVSDAAIVSWLQAARNLAQAIYDRITANTGLWGVQRLYTARPAFSVGNELSQFTLFEEWSVPVSWRRAGEALVGRGRALSIGYSAGWFDEAEYKKIASTDEGVGAYPLRNVRTAPVVDGNDVETFRLYLDQVEGLAVGDPYNVRGVESYVLMEQLKVVEEVS